MELVNMKSGIHLTTNHLHKGKAFSPLLASETGYKDHTASTRISTVGFSYLLNTNKASFG